MSQIAGHVVVDMHSPYSRREKGVCLPGVDLEVIFCCIPFPSTPPQAASFFVCWRRLCLRCSPGVTQVLTLSHTHILSPSSKSDPGRRDIPFSFVCLEKSQGSERLCPIHARTTASLNQPQAQLTDDRRIDIHVNPQGLQLILVKFSQANREQSSKILAFLEKEAYFWNS